MENKTVQALEWITSILKKHNVPFQVTGGFAAHLYGATRTINDIDIDVPEERFTEIIPEIKDIQNFR